MSIESRSRQYGKVFDHWQIREFLGSGSGGKSAVFRLVHTDSSSVKSALKVISLIEKRGSLKSLSVSLKAEYESAKKKCKDYAKQEVLLMNGLQGQTNVVAYQDHTFVDWEDETGFGYDMLIRMELLTDLRSQLENAHVFNEMDVLKIGRDICAALVLCHSKNILHRDIKPENIFFNNDGNYKLGDFGVSRILNAAPMSKASTGVCTIEYAAPEQLSGKYDTRVDIYSLGLVLYELSNNNRLPFASSYYITRDEVQQRFLGKRLLAPQNASKELSDVILKACAHNPDDRYQTAEDFLADLNYLAGVGPRPNPKSASLSRTTEKAIHETSRYVTQGAFGDEVRRSGSNETIHATHEQKTPPRHYPHRREKIKIPKGLLISLICLLIVGIGITVSLSMIATAEQEAITGYLNEADTLAVSSDYVAALEKIEEGLGEYPDSTELQAKKDDYVAAIDEHISEIIAEADTLARSLNYEGAISFINTGLTTYPGSEILQKKKIEYTDALNAQAKANTLAEAASFAQSCDFVSAIRLIEKAMENNNDDADYQNAYAKYCDEYKTYGFSSADSLAAAGDYLGAIEVIEQVSAELGMTESFAIKMQSYEEKFVAEAIKQVDALIANEDYTAAETNLDVALKEFPDNQLLKEEQNLLEKAKLVVYLFDKKPYMVEDAIAHSRNNDRDTHWTTSGWFMPDGFRMCCGGVYYSKGLHLTADETKQTKVFYNLNGEYSVLRGKIAFEDLTIKRVDHSYIINFYGDGNLLKSYTIYKGDLPIDVEIPLEYCKKLTIEFVCPDGDTSHAADINLVDFILKY